MTDKSDFEKYRPKLPPETTPVARRTVATTGSNTLSKLGAHLRWMAEQEGVDPEKMIVSVGVTNDADVGRMVEAFDRHFDPETMKRDKSFRNCVFVYGIPIVIVKNQRQGASP
jgi:hypothetical protein